VPTSADAIAKRFVSGRPVNGSLPRVGGFVPDGGGLTKVTPNTVGDTEGRALVVCEIVDVAVPETLAVTAGVLVDVALTVGLTVAEGRGVHRLLLGRTVVNVWGLGLSGIGGTAGALPGLAVTVITMLSDTWGPCARASAPSDSVAAPALTALSTNVTIEALRRDRTFIRDAGITR
jgi:hypothetical protein